jgi:HEAT repeats
MILELLLALVAGEVLMVAVLVIAIVAHSFLLRWRERRNTRLYLKARQVLYEYISDPLRPLTEEEQSLLHRLTWNEQVDILTALARSLALDERPAVFEVARILGVVERAKRLTMSRFWPRRLKGVRVLMLLSDDRSLIAQLVADKNPEVRSAAVEWAADEPTAEMAALIAPLLDRAAPRYRFAVIDAMIRMRGSAVEPLRTLLRTSTDATTLASALKIARHIADARFLQEALSLAHSGSAEVVCGAARVLGAIGGAECPLVLRKLLGHEDESVRTAAVRALRDLDDRDSVEEIAGHMRDRSWSVRREAALALRAFGPDGSILLRRFTSSADGFASEMAQQVLSVPAGAAS